MIHPAQPQTIKIGQAPVALTPTRNETIDGSPAIAGRAKL